MIGRELELREVHLPQPEVGARVERAPVGDRAGLGEQLAGGGSGVGRQPRDPADLLGDLLHLLAGLEEPLGVAAVEVAPVERDQAPGGVEHVDGDRVAAVGVAHRVGEYGGQPGLPGDAGHPGGVRGGAGPPVAAGAPGSRWETSSTTRWERGTSARHGSSAARARSSRRRVAATPSSDAGPSSTIRSPLASSSATSSGSSARSRTGAPRSPASWTAEISRHTAAHPARPPLVSAAARNVARGRPPRSAGRSRNAPPRPGSCDWRRGSGPPAAGRRG